MKYIIIEDCSPYYIRFTHEGIEEFIQYAIDIFDNYDWSNIKKSKKPLFKHCQLSEELGIEILLKTPISKDLSLKSHRVSFFKSYPGLDYRAHKDGVNDRFSINYTVKILDDKCTTHWYSDEELKEYTINYSKKSRECFDFDKTKHKPLKTMTAVQGECILFNTEIFHSWDNTNSDNERIVLTFRHRNTANVYYDDAKEILFGKLNYDNKYY